MPKMIFIERDGTHREVDAPLGLSVLEIAHRNKIDIEGACEGSLACSTCHVIIDTEWYDLLKEATEDEEDMLDLAFGPHHDLAAGLPDHHDRGIGRVDRSAARRDPQHDEYVMIPFSSPPRRRGARATVPSLAPGFPLSRERRA